MIPENVESCAWTCGNGVVEPCYTISPMGCHCVSVSREQCDERFDCTQYGYYGGTGGCDSVCAFRSFANCDPCAPNTIACKSVTDGAQIRELVVNGASVALLTTHDVHLFTGIVEDMAVPVPFGSFAVAAVHIPGGLLIALEDSYDGSRFVRPLQNEMFGVKQPIPASAGRPVMASAGNRVLVAWASATDIEIAILDETGTMLTTSVLFAGVTNPPSVVSDGTSFFVGAAGRLAHISTDGTTSIVTGFPTTTDDVAIVRWSGSTGWYVSHAMSGSVLTAMQFDANGAAVGNSMSADVGGRIDDVVASGTDLEVLRFITPRMSLVRVTSTGAQTAAVEVGAGGNGRFAFIGPNAFVAWHTDGSGRVALVAPP